MSDKMRESFEKWATENEYSTKMYDSFHDDYYDDTTQSAWRAWQAAQSAAVPVVGDVVALLAEVPFRFLQKGMVTVVKPNKPEFIEENDIALYRRPTTSIPAADLDALRKDAERYRWLREQYWNSADICVVRNPKEAVKLGHDCPSFERLDSFIDAAIAQEKVE